MEKTLGHYQLTRMLGRGGMSAVYEATDLRMGRRVAVKVLTCPPGSTPEEREALYARQLREAHAVAAMSHPNIVIIHDVGTQDDSHYLVMEYIEGGTLRARLDAAPISPTETASILEQAATGLDAVHEQGIIHRDLKPSNIMLFPDGRVKLTDFGIARQADDAMVTQTGLIIGSPSYMSPEQVLGEPSTAASDIWALGVLLYEMVAGRSPFPGRNIPAVLHQVAYSEPPPVPGLSPDVQKVLNRALEKDPEKRYKRAHELAEDFRAAISSPSFVPPLPLGPLPIPSNYGSEADTVQVAPLDSWGAHSAITNEFDAATVVAAPLGRNSDSAGQAMAGSVAAASIDPSAPYFGPMDSPRVNPNSPWARSLVTYDFIKENVHKRFMTRAQLAVLLPILAAIGVAVFIVSFIGSAMRSGRQGADSVQTSRSGIAVAPHGFSAPQHHIVITRPTDHVGQTASLGRSQGIHPTRIAASPSRTTRSTRRHFRTFHHYGRHTRYAHRRLHTYSTNDSSGGITFQLPMSGPFSGMTGEYSPATGHFTFH